jgi:formylglycine-generating enzyme required for sulfatase activity/energy-coupling factor transporter ATP-binding protein EcfA2
MPDGEPGGRPGIRPGPSISGHESPVVFVAFADDDAAWTNGYLIPALGLAQGEVITPHEFPPGARLLDAFEHAVHEARFTVLVLSEAFLHDVWTDFVEMLATHAELVDLRNRVVPLVRTPVTLPLRLDWRVHLDCTRPESWAGEVARLRNLLARPEPHDDVIPCPYPGLSAFGTQDADYFLGRDDDIDALDLRIHEQSLIVVVGPSGAGKSSLVHAGVVPRLSRHENTVIITLRPTDDPLSALAQALQTGPRELSPATAGTVVERLLEHDSAARLIVVVDPFEPILVLPDETERETFLALLSSLRSHPRVALILTVRADFWGQFMTSALWPLGPGEEYALTPLRGEALRELIVGPAASVGVHIEPVLVERLLRDAATEGRQTSLPLLQQTLAMLWEKRERRLIPLHAYERLGRAGRSGLSVAVSTHADAVISGLPAGGQAVARRILVRLVDVWEIPEGEPSEAGKLPPARLLRRQQRVQALRVSDEHESFFSSCLKNLADGRLITLGRIGRDAAPVADLAHDSLVANWPTFSEWVEASRLDEAERRQIESAAETWQREGHRWETRYRGHDLARALAWYREHPGELSSIAKAFLHSSRRRREAVLGAVLLGTVTAVTLAAFLVLTLAVPAIQQRLWREQAQRLEPMVVLPGGTARLGHPEQPVTIPTIRFDEHEVTLAQYRLCVTAGHCKVPVEAEGVALYAAGDPHLPVVNVTAFDAADYCRWVGRRLPSMQEWERAARGLGGRPYPWGTAEPTLRRVNAGLPGAPTKLVPVDDPRFTSGDTPEGISELIGNAAEWTATHVRPAETLLLTALEPWDGRKAVDLLALKGFDYYTEPQPAYAGLTADPTRPDPFTGFRCAVTIDEGTEK